MARILVLTPQLPYPPQQGTSLRNYHLLRALAQRYEVALLSLVEGDLRPQVEPLNEIARVLPPVPAPVRTAGWRLRQLLTSREPDVALRLRSDPYAAALVRALGNETFEAVQVEGIELAWTLPLIRSSRPGSRIVLDCHNAETELQRRAFEQDVRRPGRWPAALYSRVQIDRLENFERASLRAADAVIAVSDTDAARLAVLAGLPVTSIAVVPNTLDVTEYSWRDEIPAATRFDLVFTGKMDYRPNVDGVLWFAREIWPQIVARRPGTTWAIVGQRPHPRLAPLRALPGVTLTGRVERVQPYLAGAAVYVMPLRVGSGTRLKVLESMAAGCAVVATRVAVEGFAPENGHDLLLADTPVAFAEAVLDLLEHPGRRAEMGQRARAFAARYDWRRVAPQLHAVYDRLLATDAANRG